MDSSININIGGATRTYMQVLGIDSYPFTEEELKTKFKILVRRYHADTGINDKEKTAEIIEAYQHLKNLTRDIFNNTSESLEEKENDLFDLSDTCKTCKGTGSAFQKVYKGLQRCPSCDNGRKPLKCKFCDKGGFTLRSGRKVSCRVCSGSGIWKHVYCFDCNGIGVKFINIDAPHKCPDCKGKGKVEVKVFNPVIPKGAVLI